jgi:hypothetical protein
MTDLDQLLGGTSTRNTYTNPPLTSEIDPSNGDLILGVDMPTLLAMGVGTGSDVVYYYTIDGVSYADFRQGVLYNEAVLTFEDQHYNLVPYPNKMEISALPTFTYQEVIVWNQLLLAPSPTAFDVPITQNGTYLVTHEVSGASSSASHAIKVIALYSRVAGVLSLVSYTNEYTLNMGAYTVVPSASGDNLRLTITSAALKSWTIKTTWKLVP